MRVAQIVLPEASEYERKCQRVDAAALAPDHEVVPIEVASATRASADVAHVYASHALPPALFAKFELPYIASVPLAARRWSLRKPVPPRHVVSPLPPREQTPARIHLPEAVEEVWFDRRERPTAAGRTKIVGSFARASLRNMVEQTLARIHRFRDDVDWMLFDSPPGPDDLASVDVWADPALEDSDLDGFTSEALVRGLPVAASRTPVNASRLEQGRSGILVPPADPNELTHAILTLLFKPEVAEGRQQAARLTIGRFRPRQRLRILTRLYETLIS